MANGAETSDSLIAALNADPAYRSIHPSAEDVDD